MRRLVAILGGLVAITLLAIYDRLADLMRRSPAEYLPADQQLSAISLLTPAFTAPCSCQHKESENNSLIILSTSGKAARQHFLTLT